MEEFKKLNTTIENIERIIAEFVKEAGGKYEIEEKPNKLYQFIIIVPGQEEALLNIYDTKKGITINPKVGSNQELSLKIAELIKKKSKKVETAHQEFNGIFEDLFEEFLNDFKEEGIDINAVQDLGHTKTYKLKNSVGLELTVNYYPNKHKVFIQGRTTRLYDDVILWFADKIIENPQDIIEIIFNSIEDFEKYPINFPDETITEELKKEIGDCYLDNRIINDPERKWLKTSYFLLHLKVNLPEYYPVVAGSIKIVEGILRRILLKKYGINAFKPRTKAFQHFERDESNNRYKLIDSYKSDFPNQNHILFTEELYNFINTVRNRYSHIMRISPYIIGNKEEAEKIFKQVLDLIREAGLYKKDLL